MKRLRKLLAAAIFLSALVLVSYLLLSPSAKAVDNPCDPVYGMIKWCKANHGHWDSNCCCCQFH